MRLGWHVHLPGPFSVGGTIWRSKPRKRPARPAPRTEDMNTDPSRELALVSLILITLEEMHNPIRELRRQYPWLTDDQVREITRRAVVNTAARKEAASQELPVPREREEASGPGEAR